MPNRNITHEKIVKLRRESQKCGPDGLLAARLLMSFQQKKLSEQIQEKEGGYEE